jgi:uracil-DNA glycosylase family 4
VTDVERAAALEAIAEEIRACTGCRLHATRTRAVPGEGDADTEVVFVGEGPGFNEDRQGRPFVGRAGGLLERLLGSIGWRRDEVFITNIVKCRPPENRDPEPDEIAACAPYLRRQLEALDPALVVTLGRHSMARFMPGARISQAHGTARPADPATGARDALVFAMYHPAAALRTPEIERQSFEDAAAVPATLLAARERRGSVPGVVAVAAPPPGVVAAGPEAGDDPALGAPTPTAPGAPVVERFPAPATASAPGPGVASLAAPTSVPSGRPAHPPELPGDDPAADQLTLF